MLSEVILHCLCGCFLAARNLVVGHRDGAGGVGEGMTFSQLYFPQQ
jgi:hypothetical protein